MLTTEVSSIEPPEKLDAYQPTLSIVVPLYNEEENLTLFFETLYAEMAMIATSYEIIAVNDGSSDFSLERLFEQKHLCEQKPPFGLTHFEIVSFSRNFGKEAALSAGLTFARGRAVIPIDADLEHPPALISQMLHAWQMEGYAMVVAVHTCRQKEHWSKRWGSKLFYRLLRYGSEVPIVPNTADFRLLDRVVVDAINQLPEKARCMKGLFAWVGFPTTYIPYERHTRPHGKSRFGLMKLTLLALNGIFSLSTLPLKVWSLVGISMALLAFLYGSFITLKTLWFGRDVPGYASILCTVLFMGGIQLLSIGVLGEYIGRIFMESKQRPLYVINPRESTLTEQGSLRKPALQTSCLKDNAVNPYA